jgi:SHS2 domain-containing protein
MPTSNALSTEPGYRLSEETPYRWRIGPRGAMRVPGVGFASRALLPEAHGDRSLDQVANVATLPGIVKASYAMPDVHWGYGFPIGGVAATDVSDAAATSTHAFRVDNCAADELLVALLEEALYLLDARGVVPVEAVVTCLESGVRTSFALTNAADVRLIGSVPKGIARSGLRIGETAAGWDCTVTVDV